MERTQEFNWNRQKQSLPTGTIVLESESCFIRYSDISNTGEVSFELVQKSTNRVREFGTLQRCLEFSKFW